MLNKFAAKALRWTEVPRPRNGSQSYMDALAVQWRVLSALMIRSGMARYGHANLGFFWLMGEPLLMCSGVMVMWSLTGMGHAHGTGVVPFALTGYSMLTLWRHVIGHMSHIMTANAVLMYHRNIKMTDIILSHVMLESLSGMAAFVVAYIPLYLIDLIPPVDDVLLLIGGWAMLTWLSYGFGMCISAVCELSHTAAHFVQPLMYITLPATGAFYMLNWLPDSAKAILKWSPLVQPFEMLRGGLYGPSIHAIFNVPYMVVVCIVFTAIGLAASRYAAQHVIQH